MPSTSTIKKGLKGLGISLGVATLTGLTTSAIYFLEQIASGNLSLNDEQKENLSLILGISVPVMVIITGTGLFLHEHIKNRDHSARLAEPRTNSETVMRNRLASSKLYGLLSVENIHPLIKIMLLDALVDFCHTKDSQLCQSSMIRTDATTLRNKFSDSLELDIHASHLLSLPKNVLSQTVSDCLMQSIQLDISNVEVAENELAAFLYTPAWHSETQEMRVARESLENDLFNCLGYGVFEPVIEESQDPYSLPQLKSIVSSASVPQPKFLRRVSFDVSSSSSTSDEPNPYAYEATPRPC